MGSQSRGMMAEVVGPVSKGGPIAAIAVGRGDGDRDLFAGGRIHRIGDLERVASLVFIGEIAQGEGGPRFSSKGFAILEPLPAEWSRARDLGPENARLARANGLRLRERGHQGSIVRRQEGEVEGLGMVAAVGCGGGETEGLIGRLQGFGDGAGEGGLGFRATDACPSDCLRFEAEGSARRTARRKGDISKERPATSWRGRAEVMRGRGVTWLTSNKVTASVAMAEIQPSARATPFRKLASVSVSACFGCQRSSSRCSTSTAPLRRPLRNPG
jgi:hypothetical protein